MSLRKFDRKQKSPWPWVTGIIIVAGLIWFMLIYVFIPENNANAITERDILYSQSIFKVPPDTVNEVKDFINYAEDPGKKLSSKKYSDIGLIKLQSAIGYIADRVDSTDHTVHENLNSLDRDIAKVDTSSFNYFNELKPAFSDVINTLESIQKLNYPQLADDVSVLKNTENIIHNRKSARSRFHKIRLFYKETANMLQRMKLSYAFTFSKKSY